MSEGEGTVRVWLLRHGERADEISHREKLTRQRSLEEKFNFRTSSLDPSLTKYASFVPSFSHFNDIILYNFLFNCSLISDFVSSFFLFPFSSGRVWFKLPKQALI